MNDVNVDRLMFENSTEVDLGMFSALQCDNAKSE